MADPANTPSDPKPERRDRKEEILQEATRLLGIYGFRGTTLARVAEAVGLTEPGLLHYFPNKVALLEGVLAYRDEQDRGRFSTIIDADLPHPEDLFSAMEELVAKNESAPGLVRLFTTLVAESIRGDHPSHDYFVRRYAEVRESLEDYLSTSTAAQKLAPEEIRSLSVSIIALMDGLQIQWLLDPDVDMPAAFKFFSGLVQSHLEA